MIWLLRRENNMPNKAKTLFSTTTLEYVLKFLFLAILKDLQELRLNSLFLKGWTDQAAFWKALMEKSQFTSLWLLLGRNTSLSWLIFILQTRLVKNIQALSYFTTQKKNTTWTTAHISFGLSRVVPISGRIILRGTSTNGTLKWKTEKAKVQTISSAHRNTTSQQLYSQWKLAVKTLSCPRKMVLVKLTKLK